MAEADGGGEQRLAGRRGVVCDLRRSLAQGATISLTEPNAES